MRIQNNATLPMNLQVEVALPRQNRGDATEEREPEVVVLPAGGNGDPTGLAHRWSFSLDEAEQFGRVLQDAAQRARDMA